MTRLIGKEYLIYGNALCLNRHASYQNIGSQSTAITECQITICGINVMLHDFIETDDVKIKIYKWEW